MTTPSARTPSKDAGPKDRRKERLRAALRENLKRRKAQARGRTEPGADDSQGRDGEGADED
ncbi:hypothetical protein [Bradyrhizobium sp. WD16]|uniref:hypothetical protein n=1 Tax=Bradyrhizobium sp. WD16 TaxID=1521768 RepID=UPI0020A30830|nr:hypothetical protein [Bradyrhizobium sp. WD16]UTD26619.1 hypothetical protein DB459_06460 [Bradyrhizobium sp. WD16]